MVDIQFYTPRDPLLSRYMEGYYFIRGNAGTTGFSYYTFPNNYFIVSVLENARLRITRDEVVCSPAPQALFHASLTCRYTRPLLIRYQGELNELAIYFKPLGLHALIPGFNVPAEAGSFAPFAPVPGFREAMLSILREPHRDLQIQALEAYWRSYPGSTTDPLLPAILQAMEAGKTIAAVAAEQGITRQYLHRLCRRYLGKTPTEFRNIQRFRNAIKASSTTHSLTRLGLDNFYYDQSHFIRLFKILTAHTPRAFFNQVDAQQENLWLYR